MSNRTKDGFLQIRVSAGQKKELRRSADRAGMSISAWVLARALPAQGERFREVVHAIASGRDVRYRLAELNDFLRDLKPGAFERAVAQAPSLPEAPWLQNQIAAMVELAAHQKGSRPPRWTGEIDPLPMPRFGSKLDSLRLHLLTHSPPPFRRRNLFVDASVGDRV